MLVASGAQVDPDRRLTTDQATVGTVGQYLRAQELYAYGRESGQVLVVIAAASLIANITVRDVARKSLQQGESSAFAPPISGDFASASEMLASARSMAGQNRLLLALIEDVATGAGKGRLPDIAKEQATVAATAIDVFPIVFKAGEPAEVEVLLDGPHPVTLRVLDEYDRETCLETKPRADMGRFRLSCRWQPTWTGPFRAIVSNQGAAPVTYLIYTN
jgi:hypothetical protein